jgi:glutamyl-tRNA synthetase
VGPSRHDGRFAPSPTGQLHLGNLRTALLAYLYARACGGRFLVRVEDLDAARSRPEHEAGQLADLAALGLVSDEPVVRQSERTALYDGAIAQLDSDGALYPCWCTRAEIREAASAPHGPLPEGSYPGTCRRLTAPQRAERERGGASFREGRHPGVAGRHLGAEVGPVGASDRRAGVTVACVASPTGLPSVGSSDPGARRKRRGR